MQIEAPLDILAPARKKNNLGLPTFGYDTKNAPLGIINGKQFNEREFDETRDLLEYFREAYFH